MLVFARAQISSFAATLADWLCTICLAHCGVMYSFSTALGAITGGLCNFTINRNWVFRQKDEQAHRQLIRYATTWVISFFLNVGGTILCTELLGWHYLVSKLSIAVVVGVGFNYFMQKYFVFKLNEAK